MSDEKGSRSSTRDEQEDFLHREVTHSKGWEVLSRILAERAHDLRVIYSDTVLCRAEVMIRGAYLLELQAKHPELGFEPVLRFEV